MPLETPTIPENEQSSQVRRAANERISSVEAVHDFESWGREMGRFEEVGVSLPPRYERGPESFDLERDDAFNPNQWNETVAIESSAQPIEEAIPAQTYEDQLEQKLMYYTDRQLLMYAVANTKAVWALKHLV